MPTYCFNLDNYEEEWTSFYRDHPEDVDRFFAVVLAMLSPGLDIVHELIGDAFLHLDPESDEDLSIAAKIVEGYNSLKLGNIIEETLDVPFTVPSPDNPTYNAWRLLSKLNLI